VDMKLEVVVVPVADVDRAKAFYTKPGWRQDAEFTDNHGLHILQLTPPGSARSIIFGAGSRSTTRDPAPARPVSTVR